jgi:hypothetical protein
MNLSRLFFVRISNSHESYSVKTFRVPNESISCLGIDKVVGWWILAEKDIQLGTNPFSHGVSIMASASIRLQVPN